MRKTARSVVEIQPNIDSVADIVVFLEVLGYTEKNAVDNGFRDLFDLSRCIYDFIDFYGNPEDREASQSSTSLPVPSVKRRLSEALIMAFPWIGALAILYVFGVSLWLAWALPISITTALIAGVFLGLLVSEGPINVFNRLFGFYYYQSNLSEAKRVLKRSYYLLGVILIGITAGLYSFGLLSNIPNQLVFFSIIGAATISSHRISYIPVYAMKKLRQMALSYTFAFASLLAVFFLLPNFIPHTTTRYLVALVTATAVLSIAPIYYNHKIFTTTSRSSEKVLRSQSLNPVLMNDNAIKSRFRIQLWETMHYYVYGTFFFSILFGDRVLSWIFNPSHTANGIVLPFVFNAAYHIGADPALLVLFPATIIQYVIMAPIFSQLSKETTLKITEASKIDDFLRQRHRLLLVTSTISSILVATILIIFAPAIVSRLGGSLISVNIMRISATSNILLSVFAANGIFMLFMNRVKSLAIIAIVGTSILGVGGVILAQYGFQYIVFAYFAMAVTIAILSSVSVRKILRSGGGLFFSKYV
ncbi:MAG: MATE family efflux transporter [Nitrososphaerales archaeon]